MSEVEPTSEAARLYRRAVEVMPGGVSRNTVLRRPHPLYATHAEGCRITDVEGVERIDFANNMFALIHGHAHPAIVAAVTAQLSRGTAYTMATEIEVEFAEHMCARNGGFGRIRFVNSGTEAVMAALKAARAFTGRPKIAKVEGTYHGVYDFAEVSQTATPDTWGSVDRPTSVPVAHGTPRSVLDDVVVVPFNDPERAKAILDHHDGQIGAVLLDVVPHKLGLVPARQAFVDTVRSWAGRNGALLVADEVVTFRDRYGGAQERYGFHADLTAMGKMIGGGFPVGAVAGRADVMEVMNPHGDNYLLPHSGTFSANPVTMVAGLTAMRLYDRDAVERVNHLGEMARQGIAEAIASRGVAASVAGEGSLFRIHMVPTAPQNHREGYATPEVAARTSAFLDAMLAEGVVLMYSGAGAMSTVMGEAEVEQLVAAADRALTKVD